MRDNFNIADWRIQYLNGELLTESDAKIDQTKKIIRKIFSDLLDLEGPVSGPDYSVDGKQDTTWMQYLVYSVRHYFGLMSFDRSILKLLPVVARIAFEELKFEQESQDLNKLQFLNRVVNLALKDLNGDIYNWILQKGLTLTYQDLYNRFQEQFTAEDKEDSDKANNTEGRTRNEHYKIIPIVTFEEAHKWGEFSGTKDGRGKLCYTQGNSIWNTYIGEDNKCFLLLRDDWKETPAEKTEGYPKDSYGLSMIWLFMHKTSGELTFSNVRWNHGDHSYNNVDHMFTPSELADLLGMSYNKAFSINVDKDYFNKSLQALFDNNLNVARQYFKLIVPVYEGYTFIDRTTDIRYYARSIREYYQMPRGSNNSNVRDGAEFCTVVDNKRKVSIFNFKTLKIEKEGLARVLMSIKGIPVYGGKVVQYQNDMFYIRTEDKTAYKLSPEINSGDVVFIKKNSRFYLTVNDSLIFDFKTVRFISKDRGKIPPKYLNDKDLLKTLVEDEVITPVPGIESGKVFCTEGGAYWTYVPDGKSPIFKTTFDSNTSLKTVFKLDNSQYLLTDMFFDNTLVLDTKTNKFRTLEVTEILPKLVEIFRSNPARFSELNAKIHKRAPGKLQYSRTGKILICEVHRSAVSYAIDSNGTLYEFYGDPIHVSSNGNVLYFRNRILHTKSFDDLIFYEVNLRTEKVSTMGKGLEGFHNIWVKTKGSADSWDTAALSILDYPECSIISFNRSKKYQVWLPDGKVFPSIDAFYYSAKYTDQVFVKDAPRSEFRKLDLNESLLTESLVDCILGNISF